MSTYSNYNIAVVLACYNRKQKTLSFLESFIKQTFYEQVPIDVYLLDDASTDGTAEAVKRLYPFVQIITSAGNLYWAGGMITAWKYAIAQKTYDLFLLCNDDVVMFENAIEKLLHAYMLAGSKGTILIGSTLDPNTNRISYGGNTLVMHSLKKNTYTLIEPNETTLIPCNTGNANILMVDAETVTKIGVFSGEYIHFFADFDYTLTAYKAGIKVFIAPGFYGICERDYFTKWLPGSKSLKERIQYMYHTKGLGYKEHLHFVKKHYPAAYAAAFAKLWLKTLFPVIWHKFRKKDTLIESSNIK